MYEPGHTRQKSKGAIYVGKEDIRLHSTEPRSCEDLLVYVNEGQELKEG